MRVFSILFCLACALSGFAQSEANGEYSDRYEKAFHTLENMLQGNDPINFKKAVFTTEWAYLGNQLDTTELNKQITFLSYLCYRFFSTNDLQYSKKDKETVKRWGSIFKVMTDTIHFSDVSAYHLPLTYDFEDFFGEKDWTKMFVSKLLSTRSGNCHSLPYLYKILAEDLGVSANLALAPNHIYIKHKSISTGWYNTELTSAAFPIDAWLMASGYIHLDAIQNSIYMKALSDQESIVLCLIDLAEGYKQKTLAHADPAFILKCVNTALVYFPNYINALILKAETLKQLHTDFVHENPSPDQATKDKATKMFLDMQNLYVQIHELGYRQMPKKMYMQWLVELKVEKNKYQNKNVTSFSK